MQFGRKKTLLDRAHDVAEQVAETVEAALEQTKEKAVPAMHDARERALPLLAEGKALAAEKAAVAGEKASVGASLAAERAQVGAALAADRAAVGKSLAAAKVAELRREPEPEPTGGKLKKLLLVSALLALGGVVFSKLRGKKDDAWQSSYQPTPAPSTSSSPSSSPSSTSSGAASSSGTAFAGAAASEDGPATTPIGGDPLTDPLPEDVGGGAPGEALSDTAEEPHQPTTPDAPADVIDIEDGSRDR